jgi:LPS export ABC transporter protein LptC
MTLSRKTKIISAVVIVLFVVSAALLAVFYLGKGKPKSALKIVPEQFDLQIKDFVYTEVGEGNAQWEIKAQTAEYRKKQNLALFDRVQIKLTTADRKVFTMSGDQGTMLTDKKDVEIKGNVVILSDTGDKFTTDYLKYSDAEKKFYTDAPVTMQNQRMKIQGVGLVIFMNKGELTLSSPVKAILK